MAVLLSIPVPAYHKPAFVISKIGHRLSEIRGKKKLYNSDRTMASLKRGKSL